MRPRVRGRRGCSSSYRHKCCRRCQCQRYPREPAWRPVPADGGSHTPAAKRISLIRVESTNRRVSLARHNGMAENGESKMNAAQRMGHKPRLVGD